MEVLLPASMEDLSSGIGGATALTLGAMQFSSRLRQHYPALRRLLGRFYIGGVLVAAPAGVYLAFTHALAIMARFTVDTHHFDGNLCCTQQESRSPQAVDDEKLHVHADICC
jgi:hypothetical protein